MDHSKPRTDTAIITVTYNSSEQLDAFLACAVRSIANAANTIVVDNNSVDIELTAALCAKYGATLIKLPKNLGYGGAANIGARSTKKNIEYLLICNPDTELTPSAINLTVEVARQQKTGLVGPKILDEKGNVYPSARNFPSLRVGIGHGIFSLVWPENIWTKKYLSTTHLESTTSATDWVSGACMTIGKKAFEHCGGFDEKFFMYFEDVDIAQRLTDLGYTNYFCPEAIVMHIGGLSTAKNKKVMLKAHHESAYRYISKRYSSPWSFPIRFFVAAGLWVRFIFSASRTH